MSPTWRIDTGDCRELLLDQQPDAFDLCVTDPPYELEFMGKRWDGSGVAFDVVAWAAILRVLKPGAFLFAFGGTRTYHRMVCAIEDAGFEIRDSMHWMYGSGFPKSLNLEGERNGHGTALKPSHEPIVVARKPFNGTVAANVAAHGTGVINVDGCRVGTSKDVSGSVGTRGLADLGVGWGFKANGDVPGRDPNVGRWPPNVLLTHAAECRRIGHREVRASAPAGPAEGARATGVVLDESAFAAGNGSRVSYGDGGVETVPAYECAIDCPVRALDEQSGELTSGAGAIKRASAAGWQGNALGKESRPAGTPMISHADSGGASRFFPIFEWDPIADAPPFFYCAKPSTRERDAGLEHRAMRRATSKINRANGTGERFDGRPTAMRANDFPTVKPRALIEYLIKLGKPTFPLPDGAPRKLLVPFVGSGTEVIAGLRQGMVVYGCELEPSHAELARDRVVGDSPLFNAGGGAP